MVSIVFLFPLALVAVGLMDCLGYFGPSDGAIDAYWALKERDPEKARIFLESIL